MELGAIYSLTGPDGTRVAFGNLAAAKADADYIGWLEPDSGIVGLDSPDMRESAEVLVGADGGLQYDSFHDRRPVAINGVIDPVVMDAVGINSLEQQVKRATAAMRADSVLAWTPTGGVRRRLALRRQQPTRLTGRRPKTWLAAMVSPDYRILSDTLHTSASATVGTTRVVNNAGDEPATPRITVNGPVGAGAIMLRNLTTGLDITFKNTLGLTSGHTLVVDLAPPFPTVTVDGVNRYDAVDFLNTVWWPLEPGNNSITVVPSGAGTFTVAHRDAWL